VDIGIIERIEKSFPRLSSLWIGSMAIILLLIPIDILFGNMISDAISKEVIYISVIIIYVLIWKYFRERLPQRLKGKIGFVISIETENDKQRLRLKNDFISHIKVLLNENNISDAFHLILLNDFQTEKVNRILNDHIELLSRVKNANYSMKSRDRKINEKWKNLGAK